MQLTDIKIRKIFREGPMRAVVSVTFENEFAVHDIKVIYANDKYFIVMPSRKNADGTYRDIAHPINAAFRAKMEEAVLQEFRKALAEAEADERPHVLVARREPPRELLGQAAPRKRGARAGRPLPVLRLADGEELADACEQ